MELEEIVKKIDELVTFEQLGDTGVWAYRVPRSRKKTTHYVCPLKTGIVLGTSVQNFEHREGDQIACDVLSLAREHWRDLLMRDVGKIVVGLSAFPQFDRLVVLAPHVLGTNISKESRFLSPVLYRCFLSTNCEMPENPTVDELRARLDFLMYGDLGRELVPYVSTHFRLNDGSGSSQKGLGVARYENIVKRMKLLSEHGGVIQTENYEHVRCVFESKGNGADISVTLEGNTRPRTLESALTLLDVLLRSGVVKARGI